MAFNRNEVHTIFNEKLKDTSLLDAAVKSLPSIMHLRTELIDHRESTKAVSSGGCSISLLSKISNFDVTDIR